MLVPAWTWSGSHAVAQEVSLHTIHYIEGDPRTARRRRGWWASSARPTAQFFRVFTTVKGIGIRKALRALARPVAEIAAAIQAKDARFLVDLPEIGKRTAEQIIAELHGKVERVRRRGRDGRRGRDACPRPRPRRWPSWCNSASAAPTPWPWSSASWPSRRN